jgi:hypothetical protein
MLLDPFEEQFHLPAILIERADSCRRKCHLIGEENKRLVGLGILESNAAQMRGVVLLRVEAIERDRLIANDACVAIRLRRIEAMEVHVRLGSCDEEGPCQMQRMEPVEIDVAAIHHVDGTGLWYQQVEGMDIVQLAVGDVDEAWNVAAQVEQVCIFTAALVVRK